MRKYRSNTIQSDLREEETTVARWKAIFKKTLSPKLWVILLGIPIYLYRGLALALETAMLSQFGASNSEQFCTIMTGCTGGAVCASILGIAVYMVCRSTIIIKAIKQEELS